MNTKKLLVAFVAGVIFALGLGISGMTDTTKVIGFLALNENWNPVLMLVMGGAIAVHAVLYRFIIQRSQPLLDTSFHIPSVRDIDKRLIIGSVLFGIGWGLGGLSWPGLVSVVSGSLDIALFVSTMILGMFIWQLVQEKKHDFVTSHPGQVYSTTSFQI